jgi:hypothetical protein
MKPDKRRVASKLCHHGYSKKSCKECLGEQRIIKEDMAPDYTKKCGTCGASPVVPLTGMCGPCTFGEAETADGNW